ncbi:MAG: hypothetical protein LQ340_005032, partial [Diploschistes diacapsis]
MASNFVFPPPPPPPPVATQESSTASRGNSGGNWGNGLGRGRGGAYPSQRGGNRGGLSNTWNAQGYARAASSSGYSYQQRNGFSNNQGASNSRPQQYNQANGQWQQGYATNQTVTHTVTGSYQQHQAPNHFTQGQTYGPQTYGGAAVYANQPNQYAPQGTPPITMGPPIRMGFKDMRDSAYAVSPNQSYGANSAHYKIDNRLQSSGRGRGQKRHFGEAFGHKDIKPKTATAPSVPSFGAPLSIPTPASLPFKEGAQTKKKKRQHNQLGLTPKVDDPEYSEDDADEESKLAATIIKPNGSHPLFSFSYKGKLAALSSPEDIAAWIEERRKRFPTKLRIAEANAKKALAQERVRKEKEERSKEKVEREEVRKKAAEESSREKKKDKNSRKRKKKKPAEHRDEQNEADELRKTLEKTQKRLAELEAQAKKSQKLTVKEEAKETKTVANKEHASAMKSKRKAVTATPELPS